MGIEWVVEEPVVAAVAADAARRTPGVARLEAGVGGLVRAWGRAKWQQVKGITPAPAEGVLVELGGDAVRVRLSIATSGDAQAAAVARAVQHAVYRAVTRDTGLAVDEVSVTVLDIEPVATR
ncbi:Asp23/Gls24 family envelope stress response protein [Amycolatopsis acidiphila]|uniref:Asp23/Gls24 family envelope stress response protein n=2 Tax=Amycolatopsis acidiphila TaxID=715473 RepID=A0A558AAV4_9PSEU|nr:Asp23/Gls24 family envelope stress response protein [Amycolatopsis acidiphila]